ncbi:quaternary amine ABC transporter ATP-binding protein [Varunaivibrio sulfuroxidans]|uniref:Quaternary amine transport ATP-binding protein n=1 Tax=Varunaivibrio sulfuroxidans TaxID=1773489 RepID=A0A4V2UP79_9PROT|nr:glycine betaine/L-proline ABC transporter ATP-binding protein [Varunaivibrio sulfuroxidans]TCS64121.1 glycine betaine/proline transport system ATP-binding protein [Varunaivibrio sulfuroxidans]WES31431.1 glycine betaine/L-proline ABC transporter ATP-binding protein [Varunaivibrio sulfuroxidans]
MPEAKNKIEVRNVFKVFGKTPKAILPMVENGAGKDEVLEKTGHTIGLNNVTLSIKEGETFVIMGLSGSGKSTLIRHFNRLIDPTSGEIIVDGQDVIKMDMKALVDFRRHKMSMVFQRFGLFPHRTVLKNVAYGLEVQKIPRAQRNERAREWIETVGLSGYENAYPSQLSGGMQQRVGLARALCTDPDILLMDEAFSALDPLIRSDMQDQLVELQKKLHKTIVFITHDLHEALRIGDRIAILKDGEIRQIGEPEEILMHPADDYVNAFVRDVDRSRVLSARSLMKKPPVVVSEDASLSEVIEKIAASSASYAYVQCSQNILQGAVTGETVRAASRQGEDDLKSLVQPIPSATPDTMLADLLSDTLQSDVPIAIIGDDGRIRGILPRKTILAALSENAAPPPAPDQTPPNKPFTNAA